VPDAERPRCECHDEPMWRAGKKNGFVCSVRERARNKTRIRIGDGSRFFVGREHQFPAPRKAVLDFIHNVRRNAHGTHV
jgi:hypothetical protein